MSTPARERVGGLLADGIERTPAMIARDLGVPAEQIRTLVRRMTEAGHVSTRGDGWYLATSDTQHALAAHHARRTGPAAAPTLPAVVEHLQHLRRRGLRDSTIDQRRKALGRLGRWLAGHDTPILDATPEQLIRFCDLVRGVEGRRARVSHVGGFYKWAYLVADLIPNDPSRKLVRPRMPVPRPRPIAEDNLAHALTEADEPIRTWLVLAAYCGLRACEIAPLRDDDIDLERETLYVRDGKGGKPRAVPIPPVVADALALKVQRRGWLWPSPKTSGRAMTADYVSHRANRYLRSVGIDDTLHALRHRYGTKLYELSGYDLRLAQELLGHSSPATTAMYVAADMRASGAVAALLPIH